MIRELRKIVAARAIIYYLVVQQLKGSHRDKLLGNIWHLLNPLLMMCVFYFVFHTVRQAPVPFMLYFLSGIIAWEAFSTSLRGTVLCVKRNKDLIHKFPLSLGIFPTANVLQRVYDFMWGFLAYLIVYVLIEVISDQPIDPPTLKLLLVPLWILMYLVLTLGVSFLVARIGVFFADMDDIMGILLQAGYFLNPVFIDLRYIPEPLHKPYLLLNPVAGYMIYFRKLMPGANQFVDDQIPIPYYPAYLALMTLVIFFGGFWFFNRGSRHYAKFL